MFETMKKGIRKNGTNKYDNMSGHVWWWLRNDENVLAI